MPINTSNKSNIIYEYIEKFDALTHRSGHVDLNFKHLRYFWMVAKTGSIARAAEQLHLTPQSISGQLSDFADTLGVELFRRSGRQLELTDTGRRILGHAEEIFSAGDELLEIVRDQSRTATTTFRVGCADSVSKLIACRLVEPALGLDEPLRMICREGRLASLLADLAVHRLDLIIADRPMPAHLSVRGYNHLLGESGMTLLGTAAAGRHPAGRLSPLPGRRAAAAAGRGLRHLWPPAAVAGRTQPAPAHRGRVRRQRHDAGLRPVRGRPVLCPHRHRAQVCQQYAVVELGRVDSLVEQVYAITTERRLRHPACIAISQNARHELFA
jgi:LysR family transcriptional activator of nhaA